MTSRSSLPRGLPRSRLLGAVLLLGCLARFAFVWYPADFRTLHSWREADYTQIARNFHREDANPLRPRVDWRGETTGVVEMELPAVPWVAALLYRVFGYHEQIPRILSALFSVAALIVFWRLAEGLLPPRGTLVATALFAANGLLLSLATSIQPDPLQLLLTLLAVRAAFDWSRRDRDGSLLLAAAFTAAAVLAKGSAAYLGGVLAYLVLRRRGVRAVADPSVLLAAGVALLPPLAWYLWAHHNFLTTGLSLGLSNETHHLSIEMLRHPRGFVVGNLLTELRDVFAAAGAPLAACALLAPWKKIDRVVAWYAAVALFYLIAADTSGDGWAFYYHANTIAPATLLMGFGFSELAETGGGSERRRWMKRGLAYGLAGLTLVAFLARGIQLARMKHDQPELREMFRCCRELAPEIPDDGTIVVRGGRRLDGHGHPVAYNESMAFSWMDRKGYNYAREDFSLETLTDIRRRGGRFWLAKPVELEDGELRSRIDGQFALVRTCGDYRLYDLKTPP